MSMSSSVFVYQLVADIKKTTTTSKTTIFGSTEHILHQPPLRFKVALTQQVSDRALTSLNVQAQGKYAAVGDAGGRLGGWVDVSFVGGGGEGWWGMLPGIGEALVVLKLWKNFPKKKGDVSQKVVAFYWDARGVVFSFFRFLFCMFVVFFTCSIEKIESHQCANFNRRWYRVK